MPFRNKKKHPNSTSGFTLIEIMVVVAIIAAILAVALPQLLPALLYSTHEGAARHLANYGRSAAAHAALTQENITVVFDLDTQEYWAERMPEPELDETEENALDASDEEKTDELIPEDDTELYQLAQEELALPEDEERSEDGNSILDEQKERMVGQFRNRAQSSLRSKVDRIKHDERRFPSERSDEDDFYLGVKKEEPIPEPVDDALLERTRIPEGVYLELVVVAEEEHIDGIVEIELTPLGLSTEVLFSLINDDGDVFTVTWDAVTGEARVRDGATT